MELIFATIFLLSLALALRSMKDFDTPKTIQKIARITRLQGTIIFTKGNVKHYKKS